MNGRRRAFAFKAALVAVVGLWLGNTSVFEGAAPDGWPKLIAHRGVHHVYAGSDRSATTCRAHYVEPVTHGFIENTLPSMRAAFDAGADVVELDIHLTPDPVFAVFHDWTLDCQTSGTGVTRDTSIETLKTLDLGYNITADGSDFPMRGTGVGLMPRLTEVLNADLPGRVFVNVKSDDPQEGSALAELLADEPLREGVFGVYGGTKPTRRFAESLPDIPTLDRPALKRCLIRYTLLGWSGHVPDSCRNALVGVPANVAPYLWGWPHRFTRRMNTAGAQVILWGPYDGTGFSSGIDTSDALDHVPDGFQGYVWTNKIEVIGPILRAR